MALAAAVIGLLAAVALLGVGLAGRLPSYVLGPGAPMAEEAQRVRRVVAAEHPGIETGWSLRGGWRPGIVLTVRLVEGQHDVREVAATLSQLRDGDREHTLYVTFHQGDSVIRPQTFE